MLIGNVCLKYILTEEISCFWGGELDDGKQSEKVVFSLSNLLYLEFQTMRIYYLL